jgi:outer membrane protein insertion porin family
VDQNQLIIRKILWKGNTIYDNKTLNQAFGIKEGSMYNKAIIEDRLFGFSGAPNSVNNLYLDNGYVYCNIRVSEEQKKDSIDLTISINEGKPAKIKSVTVIINGVNIKDPIPEIGIHSGELFSKAKIINSVKSLDATGRFDSQKINPKPQILKTNDEYDVVNLVYNLTELTKK